MPPRREVSAVGNQTIFLYGSRLIDRLSSDTPEILPGALIGTSASSSVSSTSSASSSAAASASPVSTISSGSGLNTGAIAGGVGGGVIAIAAIAGLLFWRRRRRAQAPSVASVVKDASPPPSTSQMGQVHPAPSYDQMPGPQRRLNVRCSPSILFSVRSSLLLVVVVVVVAVRTGPERHDHAPQASRRNDLHTWRASSRRDVQLVFERERSRQRAAFAPAGQPWPPYCLIVSHPLCDPQTRSYLFFDFVITKL